MNPPVELLENSFTNASGSYGDLAAAALETEEVPQFAYDVVSKVDRKHFWYIIRNERILKLLQQTFKRWSDVSFLEVGCGTGNVIGYLYEQGMQRVTGYDINQHGLSLCRQRYPQITFERRDILATQQPDRLFDAVGIFDVIEHISDEQEVLSKVRQHLHPRGSIITTVPAHSLLWSKMDEIYGHHRRYTKKRLHAALQNAGFKNIRIAYMMAPLVPLLLLRRKFMSLPQNLTQQQIVDILKDDARYPGDFINNTMMSILRMEHQVLGMRDFNFGGSLIAIASAN